MQNDAIVTQYIILNTETVICVKYMGTWDGCPQM